MSNCDIEWLRANGVSSRRAKRLIALAAELSAASRRSEMHALLLDAARRKAESRGLTIEEEAVFAAARHLVQCLLSRKQWSAKRLRAVWEGQHSVRVLLALHARALGYGKREETLLGVFKEMAEVGKIKRLGREFRGVVNDVLQKIHLEWWREQ